jgi:acetyltransferase-like isoleucine patch superfamily enzyme
VKILRMIVFLAPAGPVKNFLLRRLGMQVSPRATIGPCLVLGIEQFVMADGSRLGPFNVLRSLKRFELGTDAHLGQWNWITAAPFLVDSDDDEVCSFSLGDCGALTSRHYVDATGGISIGAFATVAGVRTTFMTHGIDTSTNRMTSGSITIGAYAMVGSNSILRMGARVPDRSVVALGACVVSDLQESETLYAGTPARAKRRLVDQEYWRRDGRNVFAEGDARL